MMQNTDAVHMVEAFRPQRQFQNIALNHVNSRVGTVFRACSIHGQAQIETHHFSARLLADHFEVPAHAASRFEKQLARQGARLCARAAIEMLPVLLVVRNPVSQPLISKTALGPGMQRLEIFQISLCRLTELPCMFAKEFRIVALNVGSESRNALDNWVLAAAPGASQNAFSNLGAVASGARPPGAIRDRRVTSRVTRYAAAAGRARVIIRIRAVGERRRADRARGITFTLEYRQLQWKLRAFRARKQIHQSIFHKLDQLLDLV